MTAGFELGSPERSGSRLPIPYIVWDGLMVVLAMVVLAGFFVAEDVPGRFWQGFGLRTTITLLGAVAIWVSVRAGVTNLAVAGIATLGGIAGAEVVGDDGSAVVLVAVAVVVGLLVGAVLSALVVGLRIPGWAASVGVTGLLVAVALSVTDSGQFARVPDARWISDWGLAIFVLGALLAVACTVGGLFVGSEGVRRNNDTVAAGRDSSTILLQVAALLFSSGLAGLIGALAALQAGVVLPVGATDLARPLTVVLLAGVSMRGRGSGVVGLVAAALVVETVATWLLLNDRDVGDQLLVIGVLALIGLAVGGVLELVSAPARAVPQRGGPPPPPV